jgi:hypothetical protein
MENDSFLGHLGTIPKSTCLITQLLDPNGTGKTGGAKMFTNLIESNSHSREFKRRSSFFVATVAAYALVLTAAGIVGVLTYDAQVEAQNLDLTLESWIPPVKPIPHEPDGPRPVKIQRHAVSNAPVDPRINIPERVDRVPPVDDLRVIPRDVGTIASNSPPIDGQVNITTRNANPPDSTGDKNGCATCSGEGTAPVVAVQPTPDPAPVKPPATERVPSQVLISKIVSLPKAGVSNDRETSPHSGLGQRSDSGGRTRQGDLSASGFGRSNAHPSRARSSNARSLHADHAKWTAGEDSGSDYLQLSLAVRSECTGQNKATGALWIDSLVTWRAQPD